MTELKKKKRQKNQFTSLSTTPLYNAADLESCTYRPLFYNSQGPFFSLFIVVSWLWNPEGPPHKAHPSQRPQVPPCSEKSSLSLHYPCAGPTWPWVYPNRVKRFTGPKCGWRLKAEGFASHIWLFNWKSHHLPSVMRENFGRNLGEQLSEIVQEDLGSSPSSTLRRDLWGPKGKGVNGWDRPCQGPPHALFFFFF